MAEGDVLRIDVTVDVDNIRAGTLAILKHLRPGWTDDRIKLKTFTDGITNVLVGAYLDGTFPDDTILVRIYGAMTELLIDRDEEMDNIQTLHSAGCGPTLYCAFNNGICYEFLPGEPLDRILFRDDHIKRLIAGELAKVHSISPEKINRFSENGNGGIVPESCLWTRLQKYLKLVPERFDDPVRQERYERQVPGKSVLQRELNELRSHLEKINSPVVFSHNDLLCKNVIYNKRTDTVSFIDFEYGAYNYQAYDIGNHFTEYAGVDNPDYSLYPDKAYQLDWLRSYLTFYNMADDRPQQPVTDQQVETLYVQVNKYSLAANFLWGIWALVQAHVSTIDFDFLGYGIVRLNEYLAKKEEFFALRLPS